MHAQKHAHKETQTPVFRIKSSKILDSLKFEIFAVQFAVLLWSECGEKIEMSRAIRNPASCICENKSADQLPGNCTADQRLCFHLWIEQFLFFLSQKL